MVNVIMISTLRVMWLYCLMSKLEHFEALKQSTKIITIIYSLKYLFLTENVLFW